ncbi:MAG TPA: hypothetical protein VM737_08330 [Gemmatimonadota bacterium]|nr:hypothetical protein [Gemmatimonadota bacterium]
MTDDHVAEVPGSERILRNAYRLLGLPGEADWAAICAAAEREEETGWDLRWLGPVPRTRADRGLALNRLLDPHQRLRDRLFWFHEAVAEGAVRDLDPRLLRNAMEGWASTSLVTARHDAALVALLAAMTLDSEMADGSLWGSVLDRWRAVIESEEYWVAVIRVEKEGGFGVPAPFGEIYEVREKALEMVAAIPAGIFRAAVLEGDLDAARRAAAILREGLPEESFASLIGDLAERLEEAAPAAAARAAPEIEPALPYFGAESALPAPEAPATAEAPAAVGPAAGRVSDEARSIEEPPVETPALKERVIETPVARPRRRPPSFRRALPIAAVVALVGLAVFALLPLRHRLPGGGAAQTAGAGWNSDSPIAVVERRLDQTDGRLATVILERREMTGELAQAESAVRDYQALIEDYERRAEYQLNIDREAYARVVRLHAEAVAQAEALRGQSGNLQLTYERLLDQEAELIAEYNAEVR